MTFEELKPGMKFIVKAHGKGSFMYWTLSGATVKLEDAAIYTLETMCGLHKAVLGHNKNLEFIEVE